MSDIIGNPSMLQRLRNWAEKKMPGFSLDDDMLLDLQETTERTAEALGAIPSYRRPATALHNEVPSGQRINQLFVWVARDGNGDEGIISATFQGTIWVALITSKPEVAEMMEGHALDVQRRSLTTDRPVTAILRRFVMADDPI